MSLDCNITGMKFNLEPKSGIIWGAIGFALYQGVQELQSRASNRIVSIPNKRFMLTNHSFCLFTNNSGVSENRTGFFESLSKNQLLDRIAF
jgi:hypothetical protein